MSTPGLLWDIIDMFYKIWDNILEAISNFAFSRKANVDGEQQVLVG